MDYNQIKGDAIWYRNIKLLYSDKRFLEFWPSRDMTFEERVNAIVRFILYATVSIYAWNRKPKYIVYGLVSIVLISIVYKFKPSRREDLADESVAAVEQRPCQLPTKDNPFGNFMLTDYDTPNRPPACAYDDVKEDIANKFNENLFRNTSDVYSKMASDRQFYSTPSTEVCNDRQAFQDFVYGGFKANTCKGNPKACTGFLG